MLPLDTMQIKVFVSDVKKIRPPPKSWAPFWGPENGPHFGGRKKKSNSFSVPKTVSFFGSVFAQKGGGCVAFFVSQTSLARVWSAVPASESGDPGVLSGTIVFFTAIFTMESNFPRPGVVGRSGVRIRRPGSPVGNHCVL